MENELKKGSLIFLKTPLIDLIYVVKEVKGEEVTAKKMDSPPEQWEKLPLSQVVKLADEQELILPQDVQEAILEQRKVVFAPPKGGGGKKKRSLDKMLKGLSKETEEEILKVLTLAGIKEEEEGGEGE